MPSREDSGASRRETPRRSTPGIGSGSSPVTAIAVRDARVILRGASLGEVYEARWRQTGPEQGGERSSLQWACCRQGERGPVPSVGRLSGSPPRCPCPSLPCSGPRGAFHPVNALRLWLLAIAVAPFWSESCYVRDAAPT
jgi:hypothetical protein